MAEKTTTVLGIAVANRNNKAPEVQGILTKYGCSIKTRVGLHQVESDYCSNSGVILVELVGDKDEHNKLISDLESLGDIKIKKMEF
jgi:hypothetical protein